MFLVLAFFLTAAGYGYCDNVVTHTISTPSGYLPIHPDLLRPLDTLSLGLLSSPDASYADPHLRKPIARQAILDAVLRRPFVFVMPNQNESAVVLSDGINTVYRGVPFFTSHIQAENDDTITVFNPLARQELTSRITNLTILPTYVSPRALQVTSVPWMAIESRSLPRSFSLQTRNIGGKLFRFAVFGDEDSEFFPENSVFDWPRPFPFAYAPAPPAFPPSETTTESPLTEEPIKEEEKEKEKEKEK